MRALWLAGVLLAGTAGVAAADDCPEGVAWTRTAKLEPMQTASEVTCVRGRFPKRGWVAAMRVSDGADRVSFDRLLVLDQAGRVVARTDGPRAVAWEAGLTLEDAADFDGDGVDEVLAHDVARRTPDEDGVIRAVILAIRGRVPVVVHARAASLPDDGCIAELAVDRSRPRPAVTIAACPKVAARIEWTGAGYAAAGAPADDDPWDARCPSARVLAARLGVPAGRTIAGATCMPGRFGTGTLAVSYTDAGDELEESFSVLAVLGPRGVLASRREDDVAAIDAFMIGTGFRLDAVLDVDGDRRDELVLVRSGFDPSSTWTSLEVVRLAGGKLVTHAARPLARKHDTGFSPVSEHETARFRPDTVIACQATHTIAHGKIVIERKLVRGARVPKTAHLDDCAPGRETL